MTPPLTISTAPSQPTFAERVAHLSALAQPVDLDDDCRPPRPLPFPDAALDAACVSRALDRVSLEQVDVLIAELTRVVGRYLFLQVDRTAGAPLAGLTRTDWERRFFVAGWSKHPRYQMLTPYEQLEGDGPRLVMAFERLTREAVEAYPLASLAAERDLHMDMLREAGRRSDAHVARYTLAAQFVAAGDAVLDAACGLGYGAALLHDQADRVSVVGLDLSDSAIAYARTVFAGRRPRATFQAADVMRIATWPDATFNLIASFETIEHIADPDAFVREATRILVPGGRLVCSVPNRWVDEHGRDPNPFHLHVFDLDRLIRLLEPHLRVERVFAQFAGGAMKHPAAARRWVRVPPGDPDDAEWWVVVARKASGEPKLGDPIDPVEVLTAECRHYEREYHAIREQQAGLIEQVARRRQRVIARAIDDPRGIVIFGAGQGGRLAANGWLAQGGRILAFVDNRAELWGTTVGYVPVIPPVALPRDVALIVIASSTGAAEIARQLEGMGLCPDVDFV